MTVWLRRQELTVKMMEVFAAGVHDLVVAANGGNKETVKAFKSFVDSAFPFAAKTRVDTDQQMIEAMKREADKGVINFTPVEEPNPLQKTAARMRLPDDFKQKMKARRRS